MIVISLIIAWWANYVMVSPDMEASFVFGWMGAIIFVPLALLFFFIAFCVWEKEFDERKRAKEAGVLVVPANLGSGRKKIGGWRAYGRFMEHYFSALTTPVRKVRADENVQDDIEN
jgi:hypothetical protein